MYRQCKPLPLSLLRYMIASTKCKLSLSPKLPSYRRCKPLSQSLLRFLIAFINSKLSLSPELPCIGNASLSP